MFGNQLNQLNEMTVLMCRAFPWNSRKLAIKQTLIIFLKSGLMTTMDMCSFLTTRYPDKNRVIQQVRTWP
jgi:hypothetical protein